jgi:ferredoxin
MKRLFSGFFNNVHGFIYGRWTRLYIRVVRDGIFPRLGPRGKRWWADRFHFKVLTTGQAKAILTVKKSIVRRDLEQVIPFLMARDFILRAPPEIALYECSCRNTRANPCRPTQVCLIIGQPFADFILSRHPKISRRISPQEAVALVEAEHQRGHVQTAWFKDAMGGRFYALCNCCKCCCFGIEAMIKRGVPMAASSGYVAQVDITACRACGACAAACPFEAVRVEQTAVVDWNACMGCGVCVDRCTNLAITLARDPKKGVPLDLRMLARPTGGE